MNQLDNDENEQNPKTRRESEQQEQQEQSANEITQETRGTMLQERAQGNHQPAQHTYPKDLVETSKEEQNGKGKGAVWRVKETINNKENTTHRNIEKEKSQPEINSKENIGKYTHTSPNDHDHNNTLGNNSHNLHNSQNEGEKGIFIVQAGVNEAKGQVEKTGHPTLHVDSHIPPPQQGKENIHSDRQTKGKGPTEKDAILKEEQWQIQTRRKNKN
ncbi:hypothetical protein RDI58_001038 [Solanum bulbocastanum]|uniref:Uncharacterized protein n=1 Tax=Solanum bulbocastanum TaxID=147425 RepID=A0AAN8U4B3_SOLBU